MQLAKSYELHENQKYTANILLTKLDEAIDDMEHGRVQSIEEAWEEIDSI